MEVYPAYILDKKKGFFLDPRTKLLFMVVIVTLLFVAHDSLPLICALTGIPLALLMINSQWKTAAIYGVLFILAIIATYFRDIVELPPVLNGIIALLIELVVRFFPAFMMGYYIIKSTKADEFVTAMERWHITKKSFDSNCSSFSLCPHYARGGSLDNRGNENAGNTIRNTKILAFSRFSVGISAHPSSNLCCQNWR